MSQWTANKAVQMSCDLSLAFFRSPCDLGKTSSPLGLNFTVCKRLQGHLTYNVISDLSEMPISSNYNAYKALAD